VKRYRFLLLTLLFLSTLVACKGTLEVGVQHTPTATLEPTPIATLQPTNTPEPAPTPGPRGELAVLKGALWLIDLRGGEPRRLGDWFPTYSHLYFQWSPEGKEMVYGQQADLWVLDAETGQTRNLTNTPDRWELMPAWSPDGTKIAFASRPMEPEEYGQTEDTMSGAFGGHLTIVRADGSGYWIVDEQGTISSSPPSWAPDSVRLAYAADGQLRLYDLYTNQRVVLTPPDFDLDVVYLDGPAWSPDGHFIAAYFSRSAELADWDALGAGTAPDVDQGVTLLDPEAQTARGLFEWEAPFVGEVPMLRWQPGGDRLLIDIRAAPRVPQQAGLWLADAASGEVTALPVAAYDVDWSPDGGWIAAIDLDDSERLVLIEVEQPMVESVVYRWPYGLEGLAWRPASGP
jgi:dipeptidyl aminopeptidase/acylaminoacyl peptidase